MFDLSFVDPGAISPSRKQEKAGERHAIADTICSGWLMLVELFQRGIVWLFNRDGTVSRKFICRLKVETSRS
jgi:hypothetical protein